MCGAMENYVTLLVGIIFSGNLTPQAEVLGQLVFSLRKPDSALSKLLIESTSDWFSLLW